MADKTLTFQGWPAGIDNRSPDFALREGAARNLVNCDVRTSGKIQRRKGYAKLVSATNPHSLYSNGSVTLYVTEGVLKTLDGTVLDAEWGNSRTVYTEIAGQVFFSNGVSAGRWQNGYKPWGVTNPPWQPQADAMPTGGLHAGTYQVAITWRDAEGIESGTGQGETVEVSEGGGILLSDFPTPPAFVETVSIYVTSHNGTEFYLVGDYPAWTTTAVIEAGIRSITLDNQYQGPMPGVSQLCAQGGRIYGAYGSTIYVTEPFNPHITSLDGVQFESPIQVLLPVTDGVYVVTERKAYFMSFEGEVPQRRELAYHGGIPGCIAVDPINPGVLWLGEKGLMRGLPGGENQNLTEKVALPNADEGAMTIREQDGERYAVISLRGVSANPLTSTSWTARETARNGHPF